MGCPPLRERRAVPRRPAERPAAAGLTQQDRLGRTVGYIVEPDVAVQIEDTVIIDRDRRLDIVGGTPRRRSDRACRRKDINVAT